jgi:L-amino acid N-acyltransferase YncA
MSEIAAPDCRIEAMTRADWPQVTLIYGQGIATRQATFESEVPDWESWDAHHLQACRLVARPPRRAPGGDSAGLFGWAALSPVSYRRVYVGVAEDSIYMEAGARGRGIGRALLLALIAASEASGIWTLQATLFKENEPSLKLHLECGFRLVGVRQHIARLDGAWRDTVVLERRSRLVGTR